MTGRVNPIEKATQEKMMRSGALFGAGVVAAVMLMGAELSDARAQQEAQPVMPADLSQGQIESFAGAALEVRQVEQDFNAEMQGAQDAQQLERLHQEAQQQAEQAIENNGLSVDEYNAIAQAAHQDPQLYATIVQAMEQKVQ